MKNKKRYTRFQIGPVKIFLHKIKTLIGNILMFYFLSVITLGFCVLASFIILFGLDWIINFIFNFSVVDMFDYWARKNELSNIVQFLIILPIFLFFFKDALGDLLFKKIDWQSKEIQIYNPFSHEGGFYCYKANLKFVEKNKFKYKKYTKKDHDRIIKEHTKKFKKKNK